MSTNPTDADSREIQPATPWLRRLVLVLVPALLAGSALATYWLRRRLLDLEYLALSSPSDAAQGLLELSARFLLGLAVVLGVLGSWYAVVAWKTLRSERFPPEGVAVPRDTPVRHGVAARIRGLVGLFLALLLLLMAVVLPTFGPWMLYEVLWPAFEMTE